MISKSSDSANISISKIAVQEKSRLEICSSVVVIVHITLLRKNCQTSRAK